MPHTHTPMLGNARKFYIGTSSGNPASISYTWLAGEQNNSVTLNGNAKNGVKAGEETVLVLDGPSVTVNAANDGMTVKSEAKARGKGGAGVSNATAWIISRSTSETWLETSRIGPE